MRTGTFTPHYNSSKWYLNVKRNVKEQRIKGLSNFFQKTFDAWALCRHIHLSKENKPVNSQWIIFVHTVILVIILPKYTECIFLKHWCSFGNWAQDFNVKAVEKSLAESRMKKSRWKTCVFLFSITLNTSSITPSPPPRTPTPPPPPPGTTTALIISSYLRCVYWLLNSLSTRRPPATETCTCPREPER